MSADKLAFVFISDSDADRSALTMICDLQRPDGVMEKITLTLSGYEDPRAAVAVLAKIGSNKELIADMFAAVSP